MAVPHPETEFARLQKVLGKGLPPVLLVTGASDHFRARAMDAVLAAVPKDAELRIVDAVDVRAGGETSTDASDDDDDDGSAVSDGADVPAELLELRGGGLFARRSCLCVRRGANWWKRHASSLVAQAPNIAKGCSFVLEAAKLDRRRRAVAGYVKTLVEQAAVFEFRDLWDMPYDRSQGPFEGELCRWVVTNAAKIGVPLQPEAAWLVVVQVGKSLPELLAELQRLRDRVPADRRTRPLGPNDLRGQLTCSFESTPFEFASAVLGGDRRAAERSAHAMFDRGVRGRDGRPTDPGGVLPFTTSWMYQSLANLYEARLLLDSGIAPQDIPGRVGVRQFQGQFLADLQRNDVRRIQHGLLALHHCQRQSRASGEEPLLLLERFLAMWFDGPPIPPAEEVDS